MATLNTYEKNKRNVTRLNNKLRQLKNKRPVDEKEIHRLELAMSLITYKCDGEAHRNAHIDHCASCAPLWGRCVRRYTDDELCEVTKLAKGGPFADDRPELHESTSDTYQRIQEAVGVGWLGYLASETGPDMYYSLTKDGFEALKKYDTRQRAAL